MNHAINAASLLAGSALILFGTLRQRRFNAQRTARTETTPETLDELRASLEALKMPTQLAVILTLDFALGGALIGNGLTDYVFP